MAGNDPKKYLDNDGLLYYNSLIESKYATLTGVASTYATAVSWDGTNNKLTYTKNGSSTDVVTAATLKTAMSLDNVGNFKAVSTVAGQGLSDEEKANARANIGAGDSAFDGNFSSLNNVPTTISGYGITDASANSSTGAITLGSVTLKPVSTAASQGLSSTEQANARANIGAGTSSFDGVFSSLTSKPTTISGYGITDASISGSTITLGSNTIKPVSTAANQGLTDTEKANARANLGVDIAGLYHYKGSVATKAALDAMTQSSLSVGDVYNVESDGMNYAYVSWDSTGNKPVWDALGSTFTIVSITNAEIDEIVNPTS